MQIVNFMCQVVEDYIFSKKGVKITINRFSVLTNNRQLDLLIDAYNYATTGSFNWR